jgi:S1-C subfamily serine protease
MVRGMKGLALRPVPQALALVALFVLPLGAQDPRAGTVMMQPPTGWFGVRISDQAMIDQNGNAFFDSYPVITHVDSGSPASKAGVLPGDVMLTFNAHDMRGGSIQLAKWLKPGSPFVLKIRRNDKTRVVRGILGVRPKDWDPNMVLALNLPEVMDNQRGSLGNPSITRTQQIRTRMPAPEPLAVLPPALGFGGGIYPFAGAEFTALNPDLCEILGVKPEGVFVTNVIEGSPARAAGLRGGDVVIKADSFKVDTPIDLVQAIKTANETDQTVVLQILRKHKTQDVTLRW